MTVPTDYPNIVSLYIVVQTGSRNEIEPGKSGFAHLFEHMMFRGTNRFSPEQYDKILKEAGSDHNAYTTDDYTAYHTTFSKEDLDTVLDLEADRFQNLKYPEETFKTETRAVLGEYNKNSANPIAKIFEVLRDTAFTAHTYKHTTMGFLRDVENMPNMYDYSIEFFRRYYRPEYTTIILAGDIKTQEALSTVRKHWGDWQPGNYRAVIPTEPEQDAPRSAQIDWPTPTLPWIAVGYHGPAYSDRNKESATMDIIASLAFSESSPLYQRLVIKEQKIDLLAPDFESHVDPYLLTVLSRVKDPKDLDYVRDEIIKTFESLKNDLPSEARLNAVKSNLRYSFALRLDNSEAIAENLAPFIALAKTPATINRLYSLYDLVTPQDIREFAQKYFVQNHQTAVILRSKESAGE
ncbi:MAG TPA: pitrilysin family protein [Blastocatellia bacterium]|nr:pitrilysin family protein [Blastocatellia bacterium]